MAWLLVAVGAVATIEHGNASDQWRKASDRIDDARSIKRNRKLRFYDLPAASWRHYHLGVFLPGAASP
jgi:hypothetical protein